MAGALLAPFLYGLYWKRATSWGCWASNLFSSIFMTLVMFNQLGVLTLNLGLLNSPINAGAFCMLAGLLIVPIVSLISKAPDKAEVDRIFSCYDRVVTVRAKDSIETEE